ncbi:MAG TPA: ester cyclase [Gemmatimonadaceae bacterium]|nr:ester cyclase [Gemmatimonadaceae bacterium]
MARMLTVASFALLFGACAAREETPAASNDGKQVLEAYVAAWNSHDSTAFDTLMTADAVHEDIAQGFRGGPAETKAFMRGLIAIEPDFKWTLTDVYESGSHVAAEWTWTATYTGDSPIGPVTNFRGTARGTTVAEIENGRIKRVTDYYDNASFFRKAVGDSARN